MIHKQDLLTVIDTAIILGILLLCMCLLVVANAPRLPFMSSLRRLLGNKKK